MFHGSFKRQQPGYFLSQRGNRVRAVSNGFSIHAGEMLALVGDRWQDSDYLSFRYAATSSHPRADKLFLAKAIFSAD